MNSKRVAVYCATENLYHPMTAAAKSLIFHHGADEIWFLIEHDTFPEKLPDIIRTMNVSAQSFFHPHGPNMDSNYTYMALMRTALTKIFPQYDRILSLDVDTFVRDDISGIWNTNLSGCYFAAVEETHTALYPGTEPYYNFGVVLHNLALIRQDNVDDLVIRSLNSRYHRFPEQDVMNDFCRRRIAPLHHKYNTSIVTYRTKQDFDSCSIRHFAAERPYTTSDIYKLYDSMSWNSALKGSLHHA